MSPSLRKALAGKPRMVQVDSSATNALLELTPETAFSSLVQYAEALGYKVSLKLEDQKGGQTFEVKL
jgi:hypothetical protein